MHEISWRRNAWMSGAIAVVVFVSGILLGVLSDDDADGKMLPNLDVHPDEVIVGFVVYPVCVFAAAFLLLTVVNLVKLMSRR